MCLAHSFFIVILKYMVITFDIPYINNKEAKPYEEVQRNKENIKMGQT